MGRPCAMRLSGPAVVDVAADDATAFAVRNVDAAEQRRTDLARLI